MIVRNTLAAAIVLTVLLTANGCADQTPADCGGAQAQLLAKSTKKHHHHSTTGGSGSDTSGSSDSSDDCVSPSPSVSGTLPVKPTPTRTATPAATKR